MKPSDYDGMVTQTADGSMRVRAYEPTRWQLGRKLRWLWWRVLSRFTTRIACARTTILVEGKPLELRVVAEPAALPPRSLRRH